jgi:dienelactone hydrolase
MKFALCALPLLLAGFAQAQGPETAPALAPESDILTEDVRFQAGAIASKAYLTLPKAPGPHPAILVAPEWWGCNDYTRMRAEMLAKLGYAALAMDLYGDGNIAHDPKQAGLFDAQLKRDRTEMNARFLAALKFLRARPEVDGERLAAIGYGTGGDVCMQMARNGMRGLDGVIAFHPFYKVHSPNPPILKARAKVLVCNAVEDPYIREGVIEKFKKEMKSVKTDLTIMDFGTAMQSFTVPGADKIGAKFNIPHVYNAKADASSWKAMQNFLTALWKPADQ